MRFSFRLCGLAFCAVLALAGVCGAANFSADMTTRFGKMTIAGKLYVSGDNWRQEANIQGRQQVIIGRGKTTYILDPALKQYREFPSGAKSWSASATSQMLSAGMSKKCLGKATVNGVACEKWVYTLSQKQQGPRPSQMTQYIAKDLDLPVKTEVKMQQGSTTVEFTNIKRRTPPASLFVLPNGYKKAPPPKMTTPPKGAKAVPPPKHK